MWIITGLFSDQFRSTQQKHFFVQRAAVGLTLRFCLFIFRSSSCNIFLAWLHSSCSMAHQPVELSGKLLTKPCVWPIAALCSWNMSPNHNGVSIHFSSWNSSKKNSIESPPCTDSPWTSYLPFPCWMSSTCPGLWGTCWICSSSSASCPSRSTISGDLFCAIGLKT